MRGEVITLKEAEDLELHARNEGVAVTDLLLGGDLVSEETLAQCLQQELSLEGTKVPGDRSGASDDFPPAPANYRIIGEISRGAMGRVFEAEDLNLKRRVALKYMIGNNPDMQLRFVREARAQALVEHPNLCKVYEAGSIGDQPFIAMQLIRGTTLREASASMNLEQKLMALKAVAEAVHEANRSGLIHRDIKPGNIMVEQNDQGIVPYVLDFGLARNAQEHDLTHHGELLGTPSYMAPEQSLGQNDRIDRRTDVYGLGATLYALLTDAPPFQAETLATLLLDIQQEEPQPPRSLRAGIPRDVETIVLKCLSKNPDDRYTSARALAEDLGRYLDGEPIHARPLSPWRKILYRINKHRTVVAMGVVALLLSGLTLGWGLWRAGVREELAQNLTRQVADIESMARFVYMSRPHDVRNDMQRLQTRLDDLRDVMNRAGRLGEGPGNYALGRGYLALNDLDAARDALERAHAVSPDDRRIAYALGLTYDALYRQALASSLLLADKNKRTARQAKVKQDYRDPALRFLKAAEGVDLAAPNYLKALVAFAEDREDESLQHLRAARRDKNWFYESWKLEADILHNRAVRAAEQGDQHQARRWLDAAMVSYDAAGDIAPCDTALLTRRLEIYLTAVRVPTFENKDVMHWYGEASGLVEQARLIDPDNGEFPLLAAYLEMALADRRTAREEDPRANLETAIKYAESAGNIGHSASEVSKVLAEAQLARVSYLSNQGLDVLEPMLAAEEALTRVRHEDQDYRHYYLLGDNRLKRAQALARQGGSPCEDMEMALKAFEQSNQLNEAWSAGHVGPVRVLLFQSGFKDCIAHDGTGPLDRAQVLLDQLIAKDPDQPLFFFFLARVYFEQAQPGTVLPDIDALQNAVNAYENGIRINQGIPQFYSGAASAALARANALARGGASPQKDFARADGFLRRGLTVSPNFWRYNRGLAEIYYFQGKHLQRSGKGDQGYFDKALEQLDKIPSENKDQDLNILLGSIWRMRAEQAFYAGQNPEPHLSKARPYFQKLLAQNPGHVECLRSLGRLTTLEARIKARSGGDADPLFAAARDYLKRAEEKSGSTFFVVFAQARECLYRAETQTPPNKAAVAEGLNLLQSLSLDNKTLPLRDALTYRFEALTKADGTARAALAELVDQYPLLRLEFSRPF